MAAIKVQRPLGSRSCAIQLTGNRPVKGYEWDHVSELNGVGLADCFFARSAILSPYSEVQLHTACAKVKLKEKRATQGKLKFGPGNRNDVAASKNRDASGVLELKFNDIPHDWQEKKMWLRVYFAEPKREPTTLLRLHMNCKLSDDHPLGNGHELQSADMIEAKRRLEDHYQGNGGRR